MKHKIIYYTSLIYWVIHILFLLSSGGFGSLAPKIIAMILFILLLLIIFLKDGNYKIILSSIFLLYSTIFCFIVLPASVFVQNSMKVLVYAIIVMNFIMSILMFRELKKIND
jgi:hypothetical protein